MPNLCVVSDKNPTIAGLSGWWKCDEGTGTNLSDSSGNGYDCTLSGVDWAVGYNGVAGSLLFNNQTDSCSRPGSDSNLNMGTGNWSISWWMNLSSNPETLGRTITFKYADTVGWYVRIYFESPTWTLFLTQQQKTNNSTTFFRDTTYSLSTWYHHVLAVNRSAEKIYKYINGYYISEGSISAGISGLSIDNTGKFEMGSSYISDPDSDRHFPGYLQDVRIYKGTILSANEVTQLYNVLR
jgi:hypothetical protein